MATRAEVDQLIGKAARKMCVAYWHEQPVIVSSFVRSLIFTVKNISNSTIRVEAKKAAKAWLRELWLDVYGTDPVGDVDFKKWVHALCAPDSDAPDDPIKGLNFDDRFEAEPEDIT